MDPTNRAKPRQRSGRTEECYVLAPVDAILPGERLNLNGLSTHAPTRWSKDPGVLKNMSQYKANAAAAHETMFMSAPRLASYPNHSYVAKPVNVSSRATLGTRKHACDSSSRMTSVPVQTKGQTVARLDVSNRYGETRPQEPVAKYLDSASQAFSERGTSCAGSQTGYNADQESTSSRLSATSSTPQEPRSRPVRRIRYMSSFDGGRYLPSLSGSEVERSVSSRASYSREWGQSMSDFGHGSASDATSVRTAQTARSNKQKHNYYAAETPSEY